MKERFQRDEELVLPNISSQKEHLLRQALGFFLDRVSSEITVSGKENIPKAPYIVAGNHLGWVEGPALLTTFPDWIYFMTKEETFENSLIGQISKQLGMFPVKRGEVDLKALRTAIALLKNGKVLGMMPEGTRGRGSEQEGLKAGKKGTVLLGHLAKVPIMPVAVWGTEKIFPLVEEKGLGFQDLVDFQKQEIFVNIGEIFIEHLKIGNPLPKKEETEQLTTSLMLRIRDLLPPHYHGFYAQNP